MAASGYDTTGCALCEIDRPEVSRWGCRVFVGCVRVHLFFAGVVPACPRPTIRHGSFHEPTGRNNKAAHQNGWTAVGSSGYSSRSSIERVSHLTHFRWPAGKLLLGASDIDHAKPHRPPWSQSLHFPHAHPFVDRLPRSSCHGHRLLDGYPVVSHWISPWHRRTPTR